MGRHVAWHRPTDTIPLLVFAVLYGVAAFQVFAASGLFAVFGKNALLDIVLLIVTLTAACALTYISLLILGYLRWKPNTTGDAQAMEWHFLVPCRDEEAVIAATISSARTSFPHAHVWVIDDASEDSTAAVVTRARELDEHVHLISRVKPEARLGKGKALNHAYRFVSEFIGPDPRRRGDTIIGILDADGYLSDGALEFLAGPQTFGDQAVGAAQLEVWMKNREDRRPRSDRGRLGNMLARYLVRMQDLEFRTTNSAMQMLRVRTGTVGMGGNGQFTRLSVLDELNEAHGDPWGNKLAEDYELGLRIIGLGYRNHYVPEAHVSQEALPYLRRLLTQRTRWSQGNLECGSQLPELRRSKALGMSGLLEIHYFMSQPFIMMFNLLALPVLTWLAIREDRLSFFAGPELILAAAAALVFLVLPYASWGLLYRQRTRSEGGPGFGGILVGLGALIYLYATYLYYPRAMARMTMGRTGWAKTPRNADGTTVAIAGVFRVSHLSLVAEEAIEELAADLGPDSAEALEFVRGFAVMWPRRLASLEEAVAAGTFDTARDAAGSIRVSAAMVGAPRLEAAGARLLDLIHAEDYETSRGGLPDLKVIGDDTVEELSRIYLSMAPRL